MTYTFHKNNEDDIMSINDRIKREEQIIYDLENHIIELEKMKKQTYIDMIQNHGSSMLISMANNMSICSKIKNIKDMIICEQKELEKEKYYLNNAMNSKLKKRKHEEIDINKPENSDM